jgi:hypothetical protein
VLLALRAEHDCIAALLPAPYCARWQVLQKSTGEVTSFHRTVSRVRVAEWELVQRKTNPKAHSFQTCVIRGFPFEYTEEDISATLRENGIGDISSADISLGRKRNGTSNGYAEFSLPPGITFQSAQKMLEGIVVGNRYIEVLKEYYGGSITSLASSIAPITVNAFLEAIEPTCKHIPAEV